MNQTEIFQNMTRREWKLELPNPNHEHDHLAFAVYTGTEREPRWVCEVVMYNTLPNDGKQEPNARAMISAVNNTYGKGINPESVEKMKAALEAIKRVSDNTVPDPTLIKIWELANFALTAAKL